MFSDDAQIHVNLQANHQQAFDAKLTHVMLPVCLFTTTATRTGSIFSRLLKCDAQQLLCAERQLTVFYLVAGNRIIKAKQ